MWNHGRSWSWEGEGQNGERSWEGQGIIGETIWEDEVRNWQWDEGKIAQYCKEIEILGGSNLKQWRRITIQCLCAHEFCLHCVFSSDM